jgi:hypothetical protein
MQLVKAHIMHIFPIFSHFIPIKFNYRPHIPLSNTTNLYFFKWEITFHTNTEKKEDLKFCIL